MAAPSQISFHAAMASGWNIEQEQFLKHNLCATVSGDFHRSSIPQKICSLCAQYNPKISLCDFIFTTALNMPTLYPTLKLNIKLTEFQVIALPTIVCGNSSSYYFFVIIISSSGTRGPLEKSGGTYSSVSVCSSNIHGWTSAGFCGPENAIILQYYFVLFLDKCLMSYLIVLKYSTSIYLIN